MSQSNIKNFIRTGQFSRGVNLPSRESNPVVLSTILSVSSLEDEGNVTEIEHHPQATKAERNGKNKKSSEPATVAPKPSGARSLFGSMPSFVRRSTASQSSTIRSSATCSVSLPTINIMETPPVPVSVTTQDGNVTKSSDPLSSGFEWDLSRVQKAKGFITRWFVDWWLLEIISWIFSAICMAIILSVLLHYNGRPLPAWKLGLTLNSFISILSGFAKASLLLPTAEALGQLKWNWFSKKPRQMMDFEIIDSASRGPLGSMVLLANTKGV
jgi:Protein of unknown function (DUF3176)